MRMDEMTFRVTPPGSTEGIALTLQKPEIADRPERFEHRPSLTKRSMASLGQKLLVVGLILGALDKDHVAVSLELIH